MRDIDQEIEALERRMARRRHDVAESARLARATVRRKLLSPWTLAAAAGTGFLATAAFLTRPRVKVMDRRHAPGAGKIAGLAGMAMPIVIALIRSQFGGPGELAEFVLSKLKKKPAAPARPSPRGDGRVDPQRRAA